MIKNVLNFLFNFEVNTKKMIVCLFFKIEQLLGISVSPGKDQLIVFHSPKENDLVVALEGEDNPLKEDRIGEVVAIIAKRFYEYVQHDYSFFYM